jgi:hypothetical protein
MHQSNSHLLSIQCICGLALKSRSFYEDRWHAPHYLSRVQHYMGVLNMYYGLMIPDIVREVTKKQENHIFQIFKTV